MKASLIISRFDEDLSWLNKQNNFKKVIYNKGKEISNQNFKNIINLKNVGRESHTWLHHIVKNYYDLDDVSIFLQGKIDDLGCQAYKDPKDYLKYINKYGFVASRFGLLGPLHWSYNVGIEKDIRYKKAWDSGNISRSKVGFRRFAKRLFPEIPYFVSTSYGGCFAVKKEVILKNKISFYKNLLNLLSNHINPIEGHYIERLWCYMFTKNKFLYKSIKDVLRTKFELISKDKII